jgi:hypothetical protein
MLQAVASRLSGEIPVTGTEISWLPFQIRASSLLIKFGMGEKSQLP